MNPIFDILFSITWVVLLVGAIRLMANGWNLMTTEPYKKQPEGLPVHPEMADVPDGEELMVVNFEREVKEVDPLHASLQDRINQLQQDDNEDDDEDDDGGDIVALRR